MRKSSLVGFILLLFLAFTLQAQINLNAPIPTDPNVRIGKLPNGLTYYIRKNAKPEHKIELRLAVNTGSNLERDDQQGLAHFVEHMAFNGTINFQKNELVAYLQSIGVGFGSDLNAHTSFDETVYILPIPTERKELVDKGLLVLSDWASGVTFDADEINKERGIVLEEMRLGTGAEQRIRDKYFPKLFAGSQYAIRMPIGKKEILENFNRQTIVDFYETWYRPDLMAVVAVGDLDPNEMEAKIKAQFSGLKAKRKETERPEFPIPDTKGTLVEILTDKETALTTVQLMYKKPAFKIKTAADLREDNIRQIYEALLNMRLYEIGQLPNSPFIDANAQFSSLARGKSAFILSGTTNPQGVKTAIQTLLNENRRVQEFGFTQSEFDRLKQAYQTNLESSYKERDKTESRRFADRYVSNFLNRKPVLGSEFEYQFGKTVVPTITLAEVNRLAKQTTTEENRAIIVAGTEQAGVKYPTEAEILQLLKESAMAKLTPYTETITNEPLVKDLPTTATITNEKKDAQSGITYWTLSNGVKVVFKPTNFQADEIQMSGFAPGGMSLVDTEKARSGLYFTEVIGDSGVKNLSSIQLNKMLAGKRAGVSISVDDLYETVDGYSTPKDFETMLQLTYLKFTDTNLDKTVFDSVIGKNKRLIPSLTANPQFYFNQQISKIVSNNHPRVFDSYDATNLDKARFEDIQAIYKERFADASGFTFVFVGNIEPEKVKPEILKYLGNLPGKNRRETWKDWGITSPAGPLEKTIKKGVEDRSSVVISYTGETPYSVDENRSLSAAGELLTIKLIEVLREEKGGVYGVGAGGRLTKNPRGRFSFTIQFACAPQNVEPLIKAVTAEIAKIQNGEIEQNELNKVKETRLVKIEESYKTNGYWMAIIRNNLMQGNDLLTIEEARARTNAINKDNVQKAAQKYLKPENRLQFVLMPETAATVKAGQTPKGN